MVQDKHRKSLPVPTPEQTARFADHVANNHSWYKHLPFFPPGASFVVFPNLHAGRRLKAEGERFVAFDIERGDYFAHHSRLSTAEYLAQFGHWDYWVDRDPGAVELRPGPWLYSDDGSSELLADDLKRQWSCRLTAFLRPIPPMFKYSEYRLDPEVEAFVAYARAHPGDPDVVRYLPVVEELRRVAGTWGSPALFAFMESEAQAQRELLLGTLSRMCETWADWQSASSGNPSVQMPK